MSTTQSPPLLQLSDKTFFTDVKPIDPYQSGLRKYVDNLQNKIDYAKWKQRTVCEFNYLPLKRIAEKVQFEKDAYVKKLEREEEECRKILSGKQLTVQLDLFREFSQKLTEKIHDLELRISNEKIRQEILRREAAEKRTRLKNILKDNMELIQSSLEQVGITNRQEILTIVRSRSVKSRLTETAQTNDQHRRRSLNRSKPSSSVGARRSVYGSQKTYEECLDKLMSSIQSMKSSQDIQEGIYLDIMGRPQKSVGLGQRKYSFRSKISDTLHQKYGSVKTLQARNSKNKADFVMEWLTFKQLNWKQILGIVMVKDRRCDKIRNLLRFK